MAVMRKSPFASVTGASHSAWRLVINKYIYFCMQIYALKNANTATFKNAGD